MWLPRAAITVPGLLFLVSAPALPGEFCFDVDLPIPDNGQIVSEQDIVSSEECPEIDDLNALRAAAIDQAIQKARNREIFARLFRKVFGINRSRFGQRAVDQVDAVLGEEIRKGLHHCDHGVDLTFFRGDGETLVLQAQREKRPLRRVD